MAMLKFSLVQRGLRLLPTQHSFQPLALSHRLLHNLASNTYDKEPSSEDTAPIVIMHGLFGSRKNWGTISKALNANTKPTRKVTHWIGVI